MTIQPSIDQAKEAASAGNAKRAIVILREIIKQQPRNVDAWLALAEIVDKPEQAQQCLERVLQIDPNHPVARQKLLGEQPPELEFDFGSEQEPESPVGDPQELDFTKLSFPEPIVSSQALQTDIEPDQNQVAASPQVPAPTAPRQETAPRQKPKPKKRTQKKKKGLSGIEIAMIGVIVFLCFCLGMLGLATLGNSGILEPEPTSLPEEVTAVIYENIRASNNKDADGYMATIHSDSPLYNSTKEALDDAFSLNLSYRLSDVYIIEQSSNKAVVHFVLTTRLISGSAIFRDNRVTGEMTLRKEDGAWKIYNQKVIDVEYLD